MQWVSTGELRNDTTGLNTDLVISQWINQTYDRKNDNRLCSIIEHLGCTGNNLRMEIPV